MRDMMVEDLGEGLVQFLVKNRGRAQNGRYEDLVGIEDRKHGFQGRGAAEVGEKHETFYGESALVVVFCGEEVVASS